MNDLLLSAIIIDREHSGEMRSRLNTQKIVLPIIRESNLTREPRFPDWTRHRMASLCRLRLRTVAKSKITIFFMSPIQIFSKPVMASVVYIHWANTPCGTAWCPSDVPFSHWRRHLIRHLLIFFLYLYKARTYKLYISNSNTLMNFEHRVKLPPNTLGSFLPLV